jgi:hypothetical protein
MSTRMSTRTFVATLFALGLLSFDAGDATASQAEEAAWKISSVSLPTNFAPETEGTIFLVANNLGAKATEGQITFTDEVPAGFEILETLNEKKELVPAVTRIRDPGAEEPKCKAVLQTVTCTTNGPIRPGYQMEVRIFVKAPASKQSATNQASVSGGGAKDAATSSELVVDSEDASFDFLPGSAGFDAPFTDPDGAATTQAGSHPYQLTVDAGFPTRLPAPDFLTAAGHLRDAIVDFPRGVIVNPASTPQLCTEAELITETSPGCPLESQVGTISAITVGAGTEEAYVSPLYNMVPPPGEAAALGFDALGAGVFIHVLGEVRSDGDYGLSGGVHEAPALPPHPVFGSRVDLWGDITLKSHDDLRGSCVFAVIVESCPLPTADEQPALLSLPGECTEEPLRFEAHADSWEVPGLFEHAQYESSDLLDQPVELQGCEQLKFKPTLTLRPTTGLADSPSGLDAELQQPQNFDPEENSTAPLRDALVTLPPGLSANASQADGLGVCTGAQIGMLSGVGQSPVRLSKAPDSCPDASKLGTVEVESPLLAQIDEDNKVVRDSAGNPVPRPLHGNLFLAKPFDNPFSSLLAIYIAVEDPRSGVVAKLAGRVEPDPVSGQLSTRFSENPQLPLSDVRLHLFAGSRASLQTPPSCGAHTTNSILTPWSAPATPSVPIADSFEITAFPGGGACPAQAPNAPSFTAGTTTPLAGAFSPLALKLSREDGSQRLAKLETTLPGGLLARLAGVGQCSDAQIAAAAARSRPEEGALEKAAPSCPASSQLGVITVGAGSGPSPVYIQGHAYLAGPYKGAPLSVATITPAVAGPFDLGTVVVQSALHIDPTTAQGRVVSDPFPQILQGIPANVRSVAVAVDRPRFSLNPTSCDPKRFTGAATSALGQVAPLSSPFKVGGCDALGFKPKLSLRLFGRTTRGAHPRLRAVLSARPGDANIAATSVALPRSEFIDQAHFRTICTRVQFAADQCPAGSIYGQIKAFSPLVDYPLQGPIYLRSSSHTLPDVVAVLKGPPSQPIEVELVGRVDSVNGGIRTRFETLPDAPVTKAIVTLQGGKKGLFQNSTNICRTTHRATVKMDGQNGKVYDTRPALKVKCPKAHKKKGKKGSRG